MELQLTLMLNPNWVAKFTDRIADFAEEETAHHSQFARLEFRCFIRSTRFPLHPTGFFDEN